MELQLLMIAVKLIDICAIHTTDGNQLMVIERGNAIKEALVETIWKSFASSPDNKVLTLKQQAALFIPHGSEISAATISGKIYAIQQSNFKDALHLFSFSMGEVKATSVVPELTRINISIESSMKVKLPPNGEWSTPHLSTRRCLFNQSNIPIDDMNNLIIANTADATAWLFSVNGQVVTERASFSDCAEPQIVEVMKNKLLFYRRSPDNWPLFYNLPDTRMGAELLPLMIHKLNGDYTICETNRTMSNGWDTGSSFAFDVCSTEDNAIVLATVTGTLKRPHLQVLVSRDAGTRWEEKQFITLTEVPFRTRITATKKKILVACTFKKHDGYHVMAAEFDR